MQHLYFTIVDLEWFQIYYDSCAASWTFYVFGVGFNLTVYLKNSILELHSYGLLFLLLWLCLGLNIVDAALVLSLSRNLQLEGRRCLNHPFDYSHLLPYIILHYRTISINWQLWVSRELLIGLLGSYFKVTVYYFFEEAGLIGWMELDLCNLRERLELLLIIPRRKNICYWSAETFVSYDNSIFESRSKYLKLSIVLPYFIQTFLNSVFYRPCGVSHIVYDHVHKDPIRVDLVQQWIYFILHHSHRLQIAIFWSWIPVIIRAIRAISLHDSASRLDYRFYAILALRFLTLRYDFLIASQYHNLINGLNL